MTTPGFMHASIAAAFIFLVPLLSVSPAVSLDDCLALAREANPSLEAATHRVQAAVAAVEEARSGYYPTITLSGGYTRTDNPPQAFFMNLNQRRAVMESNFNDPDDTDNLRLSAGAKLLLLDGGQRRLGSRMARLHSQAERDRLASVNNELAYQITRAFYFLQQARDFVGIQEATRNRISESLRVAGERFDAGSALKTDVLHLEVQLAEADEQLIWAHNQVRIAVSALNTAVGAPVVSDDSERAMAPAGELPDLPVIDLEDVMGRPEMQAIQRDAESSRLDASRAGRDRLPKLSAFGSVDWDRDVSTDFEQSYMVGAVLEWDVFTGYRQRAQVGKAQARRLELTARQRELENQLRLELQQAYYQAQEANQRIEVVGRAVASAGEAYRITRSRYEAGGAEITELLTAQVSLAAAENRNLNATYDYLTALANLTRARGGIELNDRRPAND